MAHTELRQTADNMQATSLTGLLWPSYYLE